VLPVAIGGKFQLPTLADYAHAATRALDEVQEAVSRFRTVRFDRTPGYLSFRLSWLAQLWRRTAPAPGRYTVRIVSEADAAVVVYEVRSPDMVLLSVALSVMPVLSGEAFREPFRPLFFVWLPMVWVAHVANLLIARRWFWRLLQNVLCDPSKLKYHGV
jgi:hypothetical protein